MQPAAFTVLSKAPELFFLVCLFLLPSHSRNCQGREIRLSVFNIIGLGCGARSLPQLWEVYLKAAAVWWTGWELRK